MKKINIIDSRRNFIKKTTTGIVGAIIAPTILHSCAGGSEMNNRVNIGHIGVGSRGATELKDYFLPLTSSRSVAVCDVWENRRESGRDYVNQYYRQNKIRGPRCKSYLDMDELLLRDDIDAVHINTPDHWHLLAAIKAARAGKHIMLAKPLGLSYPNYKILEKELLANNVKFHYGTQQRSMRHMQLGIDLINEGSIGEIEKVEAWGPGGGASVNPICNEVPVPNDLDYDRWTGPASLDPFCNERVTKVSSRFQYNYCIGFLANWGAHVLDIFVWALKDKVNGSYSCEGTGKLWPSGGIYNVVYSWDLDYKFENGLVLHFRSNDVAYPEVVNLRGDWEDNGTTFFGSKGWISLSRFSAQSSIKEVNDRLNSFPKDKNGKILSEENKMGQMFIDVVTGKSKETCPLDEAIISDSISHMGDIAIRTNRKITWDPYAGEVVNDPEANNLYIREMREPYTV